MLLKQVFFPNCSRLNIGLACDTCGRIDDLYRSLLLVDAEQVNDKGNRSDSVLGLVENPVKNAVKNNGYLE